MDIAEFLGPFEHLLEQYYTAGAQRKMMQDTVAAERAFAEIKASGFLDVMRSEADGGAGLSLADAEPLIRLIGAHGAPASLALAMAERALGAAPPRELSAIIHAVLIAGAIEHLLSMCTDYANMREQFGKPIGKQQAIQHQLAIMAEQATLVRVVSQFGCDQGFGPSPQRAASAKHTASVAVTIVTSAAHAVHGAIGITAEFDLQLWVRRLYEWADAAGSASYWARQMGEARIGQSDMSSVDFIRNI